MSELTIIEKTLSILKENKEGLLFKDFVDKYTEEYGEEYLGGRHHLCKLRERGLVEAYIPPNRVGKNIGYRATEEAFEPERQKEALESFEFLKNLFEKEKVEIIGSKMTKEDFEKLDVI